VQFGSLHLILFLQDSDSINLRGINMKLIQKIYYYMIAIFIASYCLCANASMIAYDKVGGSPSDKTQYLFIHTSRFGVLDYNNKTKTYKITMKEYSPWVTFFSNMPKRKTGFLTIEDFVTLLNKEHLRSENGLNAGLVAFNGKNKLQVRYTLNLIDVVNNPEKNSVTFLATLLPGSQLNSVPAHIDLFNVALFIDDICASCGGRGT
jgi:hypothetical protein